MTALIEQEKKTFTTILLIVFIGFLGTSIPFPIFPPLFLDDSPNSFIGNNLTTKNLLLGIALAAYPFGQFAGSPILGGFSDKYGRRLTLLWSLVGAVIGYALSVIALEHHSVFLLLFSRFITGFMEGNIAIARAMAADLTTLSTYQSFGKINFVTALGYILGPLLGGFFSNQHWISWFSFATPFWIATLLSIFIFFLTYIKVPKQSPKKHTPYINVLTRFRLISQMKQLFNEIPKLKQLLLASTIFTLSIDIFYQFGPVFLTTYWDMGASSIAWYNAALCTGLTAAGWLPYYLSSRYPLTITIFFAELISAALLFLLVLFQNPIITFLIFLLLGFSITIVTTNMTIEVSKLSDEHRRGQAFGTQVSLRTFFDGCICLLGGILTNISASLPIGLSAFITLIAARIYIKYR